MTTPGPGGPDLAAEVWRHRPDRVALIEHPARRMHRYAELRAGTEEVAPPGGTAAWSLGT